MHSAVHRHIEWQKRIAEQVNPTANWPTVDWHVRHGEDDYLSKNREPEYMARIHHPHESHPEDMLLGIASPVGKAFQGRDECEGGRWITVHPNGPDEEGHPVYICPNPDGSHTITGGAGGKLNGLRLTGVKSEDEYRRLADQRKREARAEQRFRDHRQRQSMSQDEYQRLVEQRKSRLDEAKAAQTAAEREFIAAVAKVQGVDPEQFAPDPESLSGVSEKASRIVQERHHAALLSYAKQVASRTRDVASSLYDETVKSALGELPISDLSNASTDDAGGGYTLDREGLAAEHGLVSANQKKLRADVTWRRLLERTGGDVREATRRRQAITALHAGRAEGQAEAKDATEALTEIGTGPQVVRNLSTAPKLDSAQDMAEILRAHNRMQQVARDVQTHSAAIRAADDAAKLPKAAVLSTKDLPDEDVDSLIAQSLDEENRRKAVTRLVTGSNELERESGSLRQHLSVGVHAAVNTISREIDGSTLDPFVGDILGPSGVAAVLAAKWRASMSPEEFEGIKQALADQHVATQERLANESTERATAFLDAADLIEDKPLSDIDDVEAALVDHAKKVDLIGRAREAVGVARGRLEAAAAINEAVMRSRNDRAFVSLGQKATSDALEDAFAIGLTDPSEYDQQGNLVRQGDFTIHSDGTNRILEIHRAGLEKLAPTADIEAERRAERSAAIKNGKYDEEVWLPKGMSRRPKTTLELDPLERRSVEHTLQVKRNSSQSRIEAALRRYMGGRINSGHDPFDVQADVHSESFIAGLGLSPADEARYRTAVQSVAPFQQLKGRLVADEYMKRREEIRGKLEGYADEYLAAERKAGRISDDEATTDKQRVHLDPVTHDCLYTAMLADPRTQHAFTKLGDLDRDGRAAIRDYASEKFFGMKGAHEDTVAPMSEAQKQVVNGWNELKRSGDPYSAIQQAWQKSASETVDLFGDSVPPPQIATVDLSNDTAVIAAARQSAQMLGYQPVGSTGSESYPELEPGKAYTAIGERGETIEYGPRTEESVAQDARRRIREKLRDHFVREMLGFSSFADEGFNPETVKTSSDRWTDYVASVGGEARAIRTIQEFMAGDLIQRFAAGYEQRTGKKLKVVDKPVSAAQAHAEALLPSEKREALRSAGKAEQARLMQGKTGKFVRGSVKEKIEAGKQASEETARLIGVSEQGDWTTNVHRATAGKAVENSLRGMMPYVNVSKPVEVATEMNMSGKQIAQQRAIKLTLANKRQGINLPAGSGKTPIGIGAFSQLQAEGKAKRALYVVPSNIQAQFGSEFAKFLDPSSGLRWMADPSADADERRQSLSDDRIHMVVTTPEALRSDVTNAVAEDLGKSPEETVEHLSTLAPAEIDGLVHAAMDKRGWNFDFSMFDEAHRLLNRQGKPDAHMARVGDSVGRYTPHYLYTTADPIKNDASEAFSVLQKLDPERYPETAKDGFIRRYGRNTVAAGLALQREMEPYLYTAHVDIGVDSNRSTHVLSMTPEQAQSHAEVVDAYNRAKAARAKGDVDVEAIKTLSPSAFSEDGTDDLETAKRLSRSLGILRESAFNRVVNLHPAGAKLERVVQHLDEHRGTPAIIFAHNKDAVKMLVQRLRGEGHSVISLTGDMSGEQKDKMRLAFSPPSGDATADILVSSDAGAVGANLQRGQILINYDTPQTAMLHEQRIARAVRKGQKNFVHVHDLVVDSPYEHRARRRLETKGELRELMTTPAEMIDDSGLAMRITKARMKAFEKEYKAA